MIKGHIVVSDLTTYTRLVLEILSNSDFEILAHGNGFIKYYFVSACGSKTLSTLTYKVA